jgi:hypothetical protein
MLDRLSETNGKRNSGDKSRQHYHKAEERHDLRHQGRADNDNPARNMMNIAGPSPESAKP